MGERILIDIDDGGALEQYIQRIEEALGRTPGGATRGTPRTSPRRMYFAEFWEQNEELRNSGATFSDSLMGTAFSREERIILRQVPGGSDGLRAFYNVKRAIRAREAGGYVALTSAIAIGIMLVDLIQRTRRQLIAENLAYKKIFLEYKPDLTREEYGAIKDQSTDNWGKFINYIFRSS